MINTNITNHGDGTDLVEVVYRLAMLAMPFTDRTALGLSRAAPAVEALQSLPKDGRHLTSCTAITKATAVVFCSPLKLDPAEEGPRESRQSTTEITAEPHRPRVDLEPHEPRSACRADVHRSPPR